MSRIIIVIIKRMEMPSGLDISSLKFVGVSATASPVIDGLMNIRLIKKITETTFAINSEVFILFIHVAKPGFIFFVFSVNYIHKYVS